MGRRAGLARNIGNDLDGADRRVASVLPLGSRETPNVVCRKMDYRASDRGAAFDKQEVAKGK